MWIEQDDEPYQFWERVNEPEPEPVMNGTVSQQNAILHMTIVFILCAMLFAFILFRGERKPHAGGYFVITKDHANWEQFEL